MPASAAGTVASAGSALLCAAPKLPPHLRNGSIDIHLSLNGDTAQPAARRGCHVDRSNENLPPAAPPAAPGDAGDADDGTAKAPTDDASCFMAYDTSSVRLHGVHPLGGPHRGGTALELCSNFRRLRRRRLPLRRAAAGARDARRRLPPPLRHSSQRPAAVDRPPAAPRHLNENDDLLVGDADGGGDLRFSFFDEANVRTINLIPDRGGGAGSTKVTVSGSGFADYGGAYCRFGALPLVAATVQDANTLVCFSPPNRMLVPDTSEDTARRRAPAPSTPPTPLTPAAVLITNPAPQSAPTPAESNTSASPPSPPFPLPSDNGSNASNASAGPVSMVMGPGPRVVPLSVVLNGDSALGLAAATTSANFTFVDEPCEGVITLDKPSGAFTDGVDGEGEYGIYEGVTATAPGSSTRRGCDEGAIVSLNFNLIRLTAALGDRVRVTAGAAAGGETLREFPGGIVREQH